MECLRWWFVLVPCHFSRSELLVLRPDGVDDFYAAFSFGDPLAQFREIQVLIQAPACTFTSFSVVYSRTRSCSRNKIEGSFVYKLAVLCDLFFRSCFRILLVVGSYLGELS